MKIALYLHIPFCDSKCGYCAFNSTTNQNYLKDLYMQTLHQHLKLKIEHLGISEFSSVYIGGGTPSVIEARLYEDIFRTITPYLSKNAEINIEANPDSISLEWLLALKDFGVNRLSLGVQSFFKEKLIFLERSHRKDSVFKAVDSALKVGLKNINIDLIYNTPLCTQKLIEQEIYQASQMPINHLSAYQLSIDEGSRFFTQNKQEKKDEFEPFSSIGHFIKSCLHSHGFKQYEVSNYSRGYCSKHNLAYWKQKPYLGIGAGGVSFINQTRFYTPNNIQTYIQNFHETQEFLSKEDIELETLFLGLRSCIGVFEENISNKEKLEILLQENHVKSQKGKIYAQDYFLADEIALFLCS
ncbi:MAG: radical SAM family heme chaperone HemW [Helicobacter sp.]|nr:radical SAM family heme chaperone HemW [Helicobacter sp.]